MIFVSQTTVLSLKNVKELYLKREPRKYCGMAKWACCGVGIRWVNTDSDLHDLAGCHLHGNAQPGGGRSLQLSSPAHFWYQKRKILRKLHRFCQALWEEKWSRQESSSVHDKNKKVVTLGIVEKKENVSEYQNGSTLIRGKPPTRKSCTTVR